MTRTPPIVMAHRGVTDTGFPENSLPGFKAVVEFGYDGVEFDVRLTRDKELVVFHDIRLERLTTEGRGMVRTKTLAQLKTLRLRSEIVETGIPTLDDVLEVFKGTNVLLNIEIKSEMPLRGKIEERVIETVRKHKLRRQALISSFNPLVVKKSQKIDGEIKTGFIYEKRLPNLNHRLAKGLIVDSWHPNYKGVNTLLVERAKEASVTLYPWTVNSENDARAMIALGVDGLITDFPAMIKKLIQKGV